MANQKTPTSLLLTPEGGFHSFGYTARDYYHDLDPEEARDWLYFEKFKMKIHSTSVRLRPRAPARRGAVGGETEISGGGVKQTSECQHPECALLACHAFYTLQYEPFWGGIFCSPI